MNGKYICSETATHRILKNLGIDVSIDKLKECGVIENMIPCVQHVKAVCKIQNFKNKEEELPQLVENNPQGIAIRISDPPEILWHVIRLTKYDKEKKEFTADDESGEKKLPLDYVIWKSQNYYFTCKKE